MGDFIEGTDWRTEVKKLSDALLYDMKRYVIKTFPTLDSFLKARGYSQKQIQPLLVKNFIPSKASLLTVGLEFFDYDTLYQYGFGQFPLEFVLKKLSKFESVPQRSGNYIQYSILGLNYISKPQEDRIRILRLSEAVTNPKLLINILGESNDFRYTELELIGLYYYCVYTKQNELYIKEILKPALIRAKNGIDLRLILGLYTVSIKRWPQFWTKKLKSNEGSIFEVETVFGYIQDILSDVHVEEVKDLLEPVQIHILGSADIFIKSLDDYILSFCDQVVVRNANISIKKFFSDWNIFSTSGSAPEYRIIDEFGVKHRVSKSVLPLVTTPAILLSGSIENKVISKAEPKKFRIAFSVNTRDNFIESYFSELFPMLFKHGNVRHYPEMNTWQKLHVAGDLIQSADLLASSDIEKNDHLHSSIVDAYIISKIIPVSQLSNYEAYLLHSLLTSTRVNTVTFPAYGDYAKQVLSGTGGLFSGRRWTTFLNSFFNSFMNGEARKMVDGLSKGKVSNNFYGGDDSIQTCKVINFGLLLYIFLSCILMTINPYKSYVSDYAGEFFRVLYIKGKGRLGYQNRLIHSLTSNNPASKQEIDLISKLKAFDSMIQQFIRRGGKDTISELLFKLVGVYSLPEQCINIPVSSGGLGIGSPNYSKKVVPGIPRYSNLPKEYVLNLKWYDACMTYLNPDNIPGISDSYKSDMLEGIRDYDLRKDSKVMYKSAIAKWLTMVSFVNILASIENVHKMLSTGDFIVEEITSRSSSTIGTVVDNLKGLSFSITSKPYFSVINYRLFNDILNRGLFPKFRDKIRAIEQFGAATISSSFLNSKSAYTTKQILNSKLDISSTQITTLPADLAFYPKSLFCGLVGFKPVRSPIDYSVTSNVIQESICIGLRTVLPGLIAW